MNRTKIGWVRNEDGTRGFSWNPITGCRNNCVYCYARKIARRFPDKFHEFAPCVHYDRLDEPKQHKKPITIFVCSMGELFGTWIDRAWVCYVLETVKATPHRYLFLTKFPRDMIYHLLSGGVPLSCWLGCTFTGEPNARAIRPMQELAEVEYNTFVSFEPLLGQGVDQLFGGLSWAIIGSLNKNGRAVPADKGGTRIESVWPILEKADKLNIPVFIKKELSALYPELPQRQEIPYLSRPQ